MFVYRAGYIGVLLGATIPATAVTEARTPLFYVR